ncbi:MAG: PocR ligand-binding domain-containing protein [Fibrobacteria bacterium]|nr:PocR ligand-binding domain-containing protein [Fibrobacteria bacterium]
MELLEVLGNEKWQALLDKLSRDYGLSVSLLDAEAASVLKSGEINVLCTHIREKKENRTFICAQTARGMTAELKETMKPVLDLCEAGLARFAIPVIRDGDLLGQVTGCGVISDPDEIDPFMLSQQSGADESKLKELIEQVKNTPEEILQKAVDETWENIKPVQP